LCQHLWQLQIILIQYPLTVREMCGMLLKKRVKICVIYIWMDILVQVVLWQKEALVQQFALMLQPTAVLRKMRMQPCLILLLVLLQAAHAANRRHT